MDKLIGKIQNECLLETMKKIEDKSINLIVADFPYFEVKGDFDFIWKDFDEFLAWVEVCAKEFKRILTHNGSLYVYGDAKKIAYKQIIFDKLFNLENNLVWENTNPHKQQIMYSDDLRSFGKVSERILFYSNEVGMTGLEMITEEYIKPRNPFSLYLREEFKKAKITNKEIAKLFPSKTGGLTGCVSNWLNGENVITEDQYLKVRDFLNGEYLRKEYEDLRKEYEDLRKEYEDLRRPFNNKTKHGEIIKIPNYETKEYNHPTIKPRKLCRDIIETSTKKDDLVYIPFGGSGVDAEQCEILGRRWITGDLELKYCDIIKERVKHAKGEVGLFATKEEGGLFQ